MKCHNPTQSPWTNALQWRCKHSILAGNHSYENWTIKEENIFLPFSSWNRTVTWNSTWRCKTVLEGGIHLHAGPQQRRVSAHSAVRHHQRVVNGFCVTSRFCSKRNKVKSKLKKQKQKQTNSHFYGPCTEKGVAEQPIFLFVWAVTNFICLAWGLVTSTATGVRYDFVHTTQAKKVKEIFSKSLQMASELLVSILIQVWTMFNLIILDINTTGYSLNRCIWMSNNVDAITEEPYTGTVESPFFTGTF